MRWRWETSVYATIVASALIHLIHSGISYSRQFESGGRWDGYAVGLHTGWLKGRKVDLSDIQWREFRASLPTLTVFFSLFALSSTAMQLRWADAPPSARAHARAWLHLLIALVFLGYLHGVYIIHVMLAVFVNWWLAQTVAGTAAGAWSIWVYNLAVLLGARLTDGMPPSMLLGPRFAFLDSLKGPVRWHICFNLTVLRMLSFALDLHWRRRTRRKTMSSALPAPVHSGILTMGKERQRTPLPSEDNYSLLIATSHALYPPLYLAGPIITYQDYAWQLRGEPPYLYPRPSSSTASLQSMVDTSSLPPYVPWKNVGFMLRYACRLAADLLCIELVTHYMYFNSLAVHRVGPWLRQYGLEYGAQEVGLTAWWVLTFMWLKFAVIWRFFRLAAWCEGTEPPENMLRCFANNYDIEGFWKGWHASYNRWLVKYIYVPLGGNRRRALVIWPIFLFVALWHDLEFRLLGWAWLICLAFLPEMAIKALGASARFDQVRESMWFRAVTAAFAAINIAALMMVNMVGFVVGLNGILELFASLYAAPGYVATALFTFYCAAQVLFAWRECPGNKGSYLQ